MRQNIRLGRVAGIRVGLNIGALVVVVLLALGLAFGRLPAIDPGRSLVAYSTAGLAAAVLFLAAILVHELAHAVLARANGVQVEAITLWLLGGVAELRGEPRSPASTAAVAAVGPFTSAALGVGYWVVGAVLSAVGADRLVVAVAMYLAVTNLVLAVFNLIPAAPLDGGRVLQAAVWQWTGDRSRAGVIASRAGRIFGLVLIGVGLVQLLFLAGGLGGFWWLLLGWFIVQAAAAEEERARLGRQLYGVRVGDVMTPNPVTVHPDTVVARFVDEVVLGPRFSTYPLVDADGRLVGMVTLNRIRALRPEQRGALRLKDIACPPDQVPVARPDEPLVDLVGRMGGCADGRAVVVDPAGRVIGVVSPRDISTAMTVADLRSTPPYPLGADLNSAGSGAAGGAVRHVPVRHVPRSG